MQIDQDLDEILKRPAEDVMRDFPGSHEMNRVFAYWNQKRVKEALARVLSRPTYALLCVRYSDHRNKTSFTNLENLVLGRIAPRFDLQTVKELTK